MKQKQISRECLNCNKPFSTKWSRQLHCCKECTRKYAYKKAKVRQEEKREEYLLKRREGYHKYKWKYKSPHHGLTMLEARDMREAAGKCEICKKTNNLHIDHNHNTGEIRGVLCRDCNTSLGKLEEDVERLYSMVAYIEKYNE